MINKCVLAFVLVAEVDQFYRGGYVVNFVLERITLNRKLFNFILSMS